jgi:DNA (cytosine-5)-methyltransferase 1
MKRDLMSMQLDLGNELIIDNFAGGGGTSTGLEQAFGRAVDIAINHDPVALAMHAMNHPHTRHLCESVWDVNPIKVTNNQPVGLVWLSPDCKHFSKAKGGTPVSKHIRGLAWVGLRWAALTKPRVMMLENVEEFQDWGPLMCVVVDGKETWMPDPAKKGLTFLSFVRQLRAHGYKVEWRERRACNSGAPTIRKRLFLIARRDGLPIVWPAATHGAPTDRLVIDGKMPAWRTAAECIDFTLPARSIFGRPRALVDNTLRRVAKGLWRHVLTSAEPFIVGAGGPAYSGKPAPVGQVLSTITTENHRALVQPVLAPFINEHANSSTQRTMSAAAPLRTVCAQVKGGHFSVVAPALVPLRGTSAAHMGGHAVRQPLSTVSAGGTHHALASAHLVTIGYGERAGQDARTQPIEQPLGTAVAGGVKQALVSAHLTHLTHHGDRSGYGVDEPFKTITGANRGEQALVAVCLEQANGGFYEGDGRAADAPMSTITAAGSNQRLVTAYCVKYYSTGGQWQSLGDPMHTLPTKERMGLVQTVQVPAGSLSPEHAAGALRCAQLLHTYLPEHFTSPADMVLVFQQGQWWVLTDISLRMLKPRELFNAQGFPATYVIDEVPDPKRLFVNGVQVANPLDVPRVALTGTAQVRMCGNSVSPVEAKALAMANFRHELEIARAA